MISAKEAKELTNKYFSLNKKVYSLKANISALIAELRHMQRI